MKVPHTDFSTPTGNELVTVRQGYGLTPPFNPDLDALVCRGWRGHGRFCNRFLRWLFDR